MILRTFLSLAAIGALKEESYDEVEVAEGLLETLRDRTCHTLTARFKLGDIKGQRRPHDSPGNR